MSWIQWFQALAYKPETKDLYDGDPQLFLSFISNHEVITANYQNNHSLKLKTLFDSVTSKVAKYLHHCQIMVPAAGYARAISILWKLFGNAAQIRESVIGELKKGGPINKNDKAVLHDLSLEVSAAHEILKALNLRYSGNFNYEEVANSTEIISTILGRISFWIEDYGH